MENTHVRCEIEAVQLIIIKAKCQEEELGSESPHITHIHYPNRVIHTLSHMNHVAVCHVNLTLQRNNCL